ncbi:S66 peptidase family protein [Albibacterium profundi]|uniref:LD-carboxypeptidase n=1 Tax=Albibacterium profundi TaxID=3134906 RepID=A0ABV5CE30_9SPHI
MKVPPYLKKGDKIAIVAPAGRINMDLTEVVKLFESWGLKVVIGESVTSSFHQFAGDDQLRAKDFQAMLDDDTVKAIIAARGGYGTVRIIDELDFSNFKAHPKWVVGYSDITVLHCHIQTLFGVPTIHGPMPLNFPDATDSSLQSLHGALFGNEVHYEYTSTSALVPGTAEGILTGGNLALLANIVGSVSESDYTDKVLFIEDVSEYYYSVDRMMRLLKRAGRLKNIRGLIVGGFTDLKDSDPSFGFSALEIILDVIKEYDYPVATDFPAGHIDNNQSLVFGKKVSLSVQGKRVHLKYI